MNANVVITVVPYLISLAAVVVTFYGINRTNRNNLRLQTERLRVEEHSRNRETLRLKGEELCGLINEFEQSFRHHSAQLSHHLLTVGKDGAGTVADFNESRTKLLRMEMLTKVYFPSAVPSLDELVQLRDQQRKIAAALLDCQTRVEVAKVATDTLLNGSLVQQSCEHLMTEVIRALHAVHNDFNREKVLR